jgi:hypothetical protein
LGEVTYFGVLILGNNISEKSILNFSNFSCYDAIFEIAMLHRAKIILSQSQGRVIVEIS